MNTNIMIFKACSRMLGGVHAKNRAVGKQSYFYYNTLSATLGGGY